MVVVVVVLGDSENFKTRILACLEIRITICQKNSVSISGEGIIDQKEETSNIGNQMIRLSSFPYPCDVGNFKHVPFCVRTSSIIYHKHVKCSTGG